MYYGVKFGTKHTLIDWGLYMVKPPEISRPDPVTYEVEIPGADGTLDLTESLTGEVVYRNRPIRFFFMSKIPILNWRALESEIANHLHGKNLDIICDDDPDYYWNGRCYLEEWSFKGRISYITIAATVYPYKWENDEASYGTTTAVGSQTLDVTTGEDIAAGSLYTDFRFGTKEIPTLDLSNINQLIISYTDTHSSDFQVNLVKIYDASDTVYEASVLDEGIYRTVTIDVSAISEAGVDVTKIYRIFVTYAINASLQVVTKSETNYVVKVSGAPRTTTPRIIASSGITSVTVGADTYALSEGANDLPELQLPKGETTLVFNAEDQDESATITFRRGWL